MRPVKDLIAKSRISHDVSAGLGSRRLTLTRRVEKIRQIPPTDADRTYYAKFLLQCTFPHSNPGDVPIYERRNGTILLSIQPGWNHEANCSLGIPYGSIPRLLLAWIITEAIRTKQRRINLGHNLSVFLRMLGYDSDRGGVRSDAKRVRRSMDQLFGAKISVRTITKEDTVFRQNTSDMLIAPDRELWWDEHDPSQAVLWGSWINLSEEFFSAITSKVIPCDFRALIALKGSPLALDLYMLFNFVGANYSRPHRFTWKMLNEQLGLSYSNLRDVRRKVKGAMEKVSMAHPGLKFEYSRDGGGGIIIKPSTPAIPKERLIG